MLFVTNLAHFFNHFNLTNCNSSHPTIAFIFQDEFLIELKTRLVTLFGDALTALPSLLMALVILFLTRYAVMAVEHTISIISSQFIQSKFLRSLFIQVGHVLTWLLSILFVCTIAFPDVNVGHLINLSGLSSVAIGFAFQDIFKNFLAGILLLLNQTFKLHDEITVEGFTGEVEAISIRTTSIQMYRCVLCLSGFFRQRVLGESTDGVNDHPKDNSTDLNIINTVWELHIIGKKACSKTDRPNFNSG